MTMARSLFATVLFALVTCQCSGIRHLDENPSSKIGYEIIQRRELQVSEAPSIAPVLPSFDGDLDAILELALAKAAMSSPVPATRAPVQAPSALVPSLTSSPTLTPSPSSTPNNPQACDGIDSTSDYVPLVISYTYSLETIPRANPSVVGTKAEEALKGLLAQAVLMCHNEDAASTGIVMLESLPDDIIATDMTCEPEVNATNICTVWEGSMQVYIMDANLKGPATDLILSALEITIDSKDFVDDVHRLVHATFIANPDKIPAASAESPPNGNQLDSNLGLAPKLLVSFGSAVVVIFAASVYFWKRSKSTDISVIDATTTKGWNSTLMDESNTLDRSSGGLVSPHSQIIPYGYGFSPNMSDASATQSGMSAIAEEQEHSVSDNSSAIIMSEAGFSTADDSSFMSLDVAKSNYVTHTEAESPLCLLGARRNPTVITASFGDESDSDISTDLDASYRSTTPIPSTGALGIGYGLLDSEAGLDSVNDSAEDDLLLFSKE